MQVHVVVERLLPVEFSSGFNKKVDIVEPRSDLVENVIVILFKFFHIFKYSEFSGLTTCWKVIEDVDLLVLTPGLSSKGLVYH